MTASVNDFSLSPSAVARVSTLLTTEPEGTRLRIGVEGGGCSGFRYQFDFDTTQPADDDLLIEKDGARAVIDPVSLDFVRGSQLDYVESLGGSYFEVKNPNAKASCGCGNSFAV
jgi:iron-sulfur cluster insertion protein